MKIFFSHTGNSQYLPEINIASTNTLYELIDNINQLPEYSGILNVVCEGGKISSSARVFANIEVKEETNQDITMRRYYEQENTIELTSLNAPIDVCFSNILITLFDPSKLLELLDRSQTEQVKGFEHVDELGREKESKYKPIISAIDFDVDVKRENIFGFKNGETTLESLKIVHGEKAKIDLIKDDFNKNTSKLLPEDLIDAIRDIWELPQDAGTLRLFQEDSLFFIMSRLMKTEYPKEKQLLLSMPTGGGKTEAFMIPLLSHIYQKKLVSIQDGIKSVVIYPTNALANDQAMRFVELIYKINRKLSDRDIPLQNHLTIGILSGDTPNKTSDLAVESLIKICPKCGKSDKWKVEGGTLVCKNILQNNSICGTRLDFCRLTKDDIVSRPPDILITNPDEMNFSLQSPKYLKIFKNKIESIVFDEIHIYQGVFGCHIAHLLRRLEEIISYKPLYIGMSATIGNAKELAALMFDEPLDNIKYIRNEGGKYLTDRIVKTRLHVIIKPYLRGQKTSRSGQKRNQYVRTLSVAGSIGMFIGHLITDSHFRKSIIFTNYRSDADDMAGYLKERQRLDVKEYFDEILYKINTHKTLSNEELEICEYMNRWFKEIIEKTKMINRTVTIGWNRGGLEKEERIRSIHSFSRNNILADEDADDAAPIDLMVATKSLEVGIDIGDVTTVINSSAPFTTNEYVQRVGRGGRKKDSLAITVINPENAIDSHMRKHFSEYVEARPESFEDAPIIVNNEIIVERHVKARVADFLTSEYIKSPDYSGNVSLLVGDVVQRIKLIKNGEQLFIGDGKSEAMAIEYADYIYDQIFYKTVNGEKVICKVLAFLQRESTILGTKPCEIKENSFREWVRDVIKTLNTHLQSRAADKWEMNRTLVGFNSVMPELTPSLRGSGATVGLYIGESNNEIDSVSRQSAFNSMPLSIEASNSTTKSGVSTYKIVDDKGESDGEAEIKIKHEICVNKPVMDFFNRKLDGFPYSEDLIEVATKLNILVPKKLRVSYFPSRFFCSHCQRGLIPGLDSEERKNGVICKKCGHKAQQLHKIYMCEDDECGKLFDPPVPKMCMNPNCESVKKAFALYKANGYKYKKEMLDHFQYRLTKDLRWVCKSCGYIADYSSSMHMMIDNNKHVTSQVFAIQNDDKKTIEGMCWRNRMYPEQMNFGDDNIKARYRCTVSGHKKIRVVGVPRVRTIAYTFIGEKIKNSQTISLCDSVETPALHISFNQGYVIQLAKDFMRRYSSGTGDKEMYTLKTEKIFEKKYWGNYYESHLGWLKFGDLLDKFVNEKIYSCDGNCSSCEKFSPDKLDLGIMMKPQRALEDYNFDTTTQRPKKPDYRSKYCDDAKRNLCDRQYCEKTDGSDRCDKFNQDEFLRYLIIHTFKHGILSALPKYAGVNTSEIKGEVYPNDREKEIDLVLIDSNEGGSGAIPLIQKHWEDIWKFAKEIISLAANNEANILLPHTCSRYNADLCPYIADDFFNYLG